MLICLSIDFYVHLVIVSLPKCVCLCVNVYVCVSVCHCLLAAITRVWALLAFSLFRLFVAFRTKKNALETVLVGVGWLVLTAGLLSVTLD